MGVRPLAPGFTTFVVQPQPGGVEAARIRVPTIRGFIDVSFATQHVSASGVPALELNVTVPANTRADVCVPDASVSAGGQQQRAGHGDEAAPAPVLRVDGALVPAVRRAGNLCVHGLGAAVGGRRVAFAG